MEAEGLAQDGLAGEVMDSLGVSGDSGEAEAAPQEDSGSNAGAPSHETLAVQKRLKSQKRAHEREVRDLHARISDMEARMQPAPSQPENPYMSPEQGGNVDDTIRKAVSYALHQKDLEERKAHEAQSQAHLARQYGEFQDHLESMGDHHDDFHDVVMGPSTPYTTSMRDYALTLPRKGAGSAGEVLYKLGKNPEELSRIARLHPLDQAREMSALSQALISGGEKPSQANSRPLGSIKNNPVVNSHAVTDKTPISDLRARMKKGDWK